MNPSNHFIYSHRRLLRTDSPSDSKAHDEYKYSRASAFRTTFIILDLTLIILFIVCKCLTRSHPSPDAHHSNRPLSNHNVLEAMPVYIYGTPALPATSPSCSFEVENCVICLDDYVNGDCIRVLSRCKHMFHKNCIDQWLSVKSLHCPICRDHAIEQDVELAMTNCRNSADPSSSVAYSLPLNL